MKRTKRKVMVTNGPNCYERNVWVDERGEEFFKDHNEFHRIYECSDRPGIFKAPYYNRVIYMTWLDI